jgi:hypothetical protein
VAYKIETHETKMREFDALKEIHDNYPKYVISIDEWPRIRMELFISLFSHSY